MTAPIGVAERVAELAALVDGTGRLGRKVARNAAGIGELAEELLQASLVIGDVGVNLAVGAVEQRLGSTGGTRRGQDPSGRWRSGCGRR